MSEVKRGAYYSTINYGNTKIFALIFFIIIVLN